MPAYQISEKSRKLQPLIYKPYNPETGDIITEKELRMSPKIALARGRFFDSVNQIADLQVTVDDVYDKEKTIATKERLLNQLPKLIQFTDQNIYFFYKGVYWTYEGVNQEWEEFVSETNEGYVVKKRPAWLLLATKLGIAHKAAESKINEAIKQQTVHLYGDPEIHYPNERKNFSKHILSIEELLSAIN